MYRFSEKSKAELRTCDRKLQEILNEVIKHFDCTVIKGYRGEAEQNEAFRNGMSKLQFPDSPHNHHPSYAVDVVAYPIQWKNWHKHYYFAGFVKGVAAAKGINLRSGLDWDNDNDLKDQTFMDAPHFELMPDE